MNNAEAERILILEGRVKMLRATLYKLRRLKPDSEKAKRYADWDGPTLDTFAVGWLFSAPLRAPNYYRPESWGPRQ